MRSYEEKSKCAIVLRLQASGYLKTISCKAFENLAIDSVRPDLIVVESGALEVKLK